MTSRPLEATLQVLNFQVAIANLPLTIKRNIQTMVNIYETQFNGSLGLFLYSLKYSSVGSTAYSIGNVKGSKLNP